MKYKLIFNLILIIGLLTIIYIFPFIIIRFKKIRRNAAIKRLKAEGIKIQVDLKKCTFSESCNKKHKGTVYTEIVDRIILGKPQDYYDRVSYETTVYYDCTFKNKKYHFKSVNIKTDSISLLFLFEKQKETVIYVDKRNFNNYYFDLRFLEIK